MALAKRVVLDTGRFELLEGASSDAHAATAGDAQRAGASSNWHNRAGCRAARAGDELRHLERELERVQTQLCDFLPSNARTSSRIHRPEGRSADYNVEVRRCGAPRAFDFKPKHTPILAKRSHWSVAAAAKCPARGSRCVAILPADPALAHARHAHAGHRHVAQRDAVGTTSRRKFEAVFGPQGGGQDGPDTHRFTCDLDLGNHADQSVRDAILVLHLPIRLTWCHMLCFRSQSGAHGKDTRGMIRDQFSSAVRW